MIEIDDNITPLIDYISHARCILAGPGTGKTTKLIELVTNHVDDGIHPKDIRVLTFTRAAAKEFRTRLQADTGLEDEELPQVSTLHSFSLGCLRRSNFQDLDGENIRVVDDYEEKIIIKEISNQLNCSPREIMDIYKDYQDAWHDILILEEPNWTQERRRISFEQALEERRKDYFFLLRGELVYQFNNMLESDVNSRDKFAPQTLIVDEFQDMNNCDISVLKLLNSAGSILIAAGDDDQAIYEGLRKSNPECIRNFCTSFDEGVHFTLTICRRCPKNVITFANRLILRNEPRVNKILDPRPNAPQGQVTCLQFNNQNEEAIKIASLCHYLVKHENINEKDILILLSRKGIGAPILEALSGMKLKAQLFAKSYLETDDTIRRVYSLLRYCVNSEDNLAIRTWLQTTPRLGETSLMNFLDYRRRTGDNFATAINRIINTNDLDTYWEKKIKKSLSELITMSHEINNLDNLDEQISLLLETIDSNHPLRDEFEYRLREAIEPDSNISSILLNFQDSITQKEIILDDSSIRLMTMHGAKGLSSPVVIVPGLEQEFVPGTTDTLAIKEQRRLLYVSLTRSSERLYISHCGTRSGAQRWRGSSPGTTVRNRSQFLTEMGIVSVDGNDYVTQLFI